MEQDGIPKKKSNIRDKQKDYHLDLLTLQLVIKERIKRAKSLKLIELKKKRLLVKIDK